MEAEGIYLKVMVTRLQSRPSFIRFQAVASRGAGSLNAWTASSRSPIAQLVSHAARTRCHRVWSIGAATSCCLKTNKSDGMDVSTYTAASRLSPYSHLEWGLAATASMCQSGGSSQPLLDWRPPCNLLKLFPLLEWISPRTCFSSTWWTTKQVRYSVTSSNERRSLCSLQTTRGR